MILFSYNFPHKKTVDIINTLVSKKIKIDLIIAANKKKLKLAKKPFIIKTNNLLDSHPAVIAKKYNIPYIIEDHNSEVIVSKLKKIRPLIGLITGARIIKKSIMDSFKIGIVNLHPGDIPYIRGLDSILKAIKLNHKIVVTSHLIDFDIDAGYIIDKEEVVIDINDSIEDIYCKVYDTQLNILIPSITKALKREFKKVDLSGFKYDKNFPYQTKDRFIEDFKNYKKRHL